MLLIILKMATLNSALMLGLKNLVLLEEGSFEDNIMIDLKGPNLRPVNNIIKIIIL